MPKHFEETRIPVLHDLIRARQTGASDPWKISDAPPDFIDKQLSAIVGIEIPVTRLLGKWKVSQNRLPQDGDGAVKGLLQETSESAAAMADLVRKYQKE